jgi:FAD/FMN-containing dehydrogenase
LTPVESIRIGRDDPRYHAVVGKRFNKRFSARPDYVRLVESPDQVMAATEEAVSEGRRLVVTSGGHCLEGFVSDPDVRVIVDVSPMRRVYYDADMGAVAVEAGATVGDTFRVLFDTWGVVLPLGEYPAIGMGGHVAGGAFRRPTRIATSGGRIRARAAATSASLRGTGSDRRAHPARIPPCCCPAHLSRSQR